MTQHVELAIVKGIPKTPGDTLNAEVGLTEINLLNPVGISLAENGWIPKVAQFKGGGQYSESPSADNESLVAAAKGRVIETMSLTVNGATDLLRHAAFSRLQLIAEDADNFHTTQTQIEPVYLKWWAPGAPGPQYASIYTIDLVPALDAFTSKIGKFTATITREAAWRGIAPGDNPLRWYYEGFLKTPFLSSNASLLAGSGHIATGSIINAQEFSTISAFGNVNYIDVPASRIPGDAPALCTVTHDSPEGFTIETYISKSVNRVSMTDRASALQLLYNTFAASAGTLGGTAAFTTDALRGIVHTPVSANKRVVTVTPVGATEVNIINWTASATFPHINANVLRGTYQVFLRAHQSGGTAGQTTARITFNNSSGPFFNSGQVVMGLSGAESPLMDMGVVTLPPDTHSGVSLAGTGLQTEYDFNVSLYSTRSGGASTQVVQDIILMPIHEGMVYIKPELYLFSPTYNAFDNTGYLTHGHNEPTATARYIPAATEFMPNTEFRGDLTLTPKVNNRLYFLCVYMSGPSSFTNVVFTPRINIVPRWFGVRDE